jgi:transcriptional regulator with XRE-family HTH domain
MAGQDFNLEDDEQIKKLAERIKSLRIAKGYSNHEAFANDHNLHRAQYWRYEKGQNLTYLSLLKLTQAFGITLEEFFSKGFD